MSVKQLKQLSNASLISVFAYGMCKETKKAMKEQKQCLEELVRRGIIEESDIAESFREFL